MNLIERETHTHTPTKKNPKRNGEKKTRCCCLIFLLFVCCHRCCLRFFPFFFKEKEKQRWDTHTYTEIPQRRRSTPSVDAGGKRFGLRRPLAENKKRKERNQQGKDETNSVLGSCSFDKQKVTKKNRRKWKKRKSVPTFGFSLFLFASPVRLVVPKSFFSPFDCKSNSQPTRLQGGQTKRRFGFQIFFASIANADGQQKRNRWPLNTRTRAKGRNKKSENETNKIRQRRRGAKRESNDPALP